MIYTNYLQFFNKVIKNIDVITNNLSTAEHIKSVLSLYFSNGKAL